MQQLLFSMKIKFGFKGKIPLISLTILLIFVSGGLNAQAAGTNYSKADVVASELITTVATPSSVKIYLSTFRPNMVVYLNMILHVNATLSSKSKNIAAFNNVAGVLQMELKFPATLNTANRADAITTFTDASGVARIQVFPMPLDFPKLSLGGDKSVTSSLNYLMSPTTASGSYVIATHGLNIAFF